MSLTVISIALKAVICIYDKMRNPCNICHLLIIQAVQVDVYYSYTVHYKDRGRKLFFRSFCEAYYSTHTHRHTHCVRLSVHEVLLTCIDVIVACQTCLQSKHSSAEWGWDRYNPWCGLEKQETWMQALHVVWIDHIDNVCSQQGCK